MEPKKSLSAKFSVLSCDKDFSVGGIGPVTFIRTDSRRDGLRSSGRDKDSSCSHWSIVVSSS